MRFIALLGVLVAAQDISEQEFAGTALGTGGMTHDAFVGGQFQFIAKKSSKSVRASIRINTKPTKPKNGWLIKSWTFTRIAWLFLFDSPLGALNSQLEDGCTLGRCHLWPSGKQTFEILGPPAAGMRGVLNCGNIGFGS